MFRILVSKGRMIKDSEMLLGVSMHKPEPWNETLHPKPEPRTET